MNAASARGAARLPPEVNRILYVRNLPYKTEEALSTEEIYDIFGKYGAIRQIRIGNRPDTRAGPRLSSTRTSTTRRTRSTT